MTEHEWNTSNDVETMLAFVAGRDAPPGAVLPLVTMNERKLRLFLVACCRRRWDLFVDLECRRAVETAERFADGLASDAELAQEMRSTLAIRDRWLEQMMARGGPGKTTHGLIAMFTAEAAVVACGPYSDLVRMENYYGRPWDYVPMHPRERHILASRGPARVLRAVTEPAPRERPGDAWTE